MSTKPELPHDPRTTSARGASSWIIVLAIILAVMFSGGLVVLSMGTFGWVIALGMGIFLFAALHYLVWGWWLSGVIQREVAREDTERAAKIE